MALFGTLSDRLTAVLDKLTKRGALSEADVNEAMREVRRALIEADVALDVVKSFTDRVKSKAVGQDVVRSVKPGQMVVKIVHDELVATLGSDAEPISLAAQPPVGILMVGLQGSGKTTTSAKIGYRLTNRDKRKVLMASLDTRRPAAMEQLKALGEQAGVATLPIIVGQKPIQIAQRAYDAARFGGYDVVILDTAGRTTLDEELMAEVAEIKRLTKPHEVLLVADALTGQDAVITAKAFDNTVGITGLVLTRVDGDGRGGAALSMRAVTGKPIKLMGVGEKWDALEDFHPSRIANRILDMGDIVSLVEKAAQTLDVEKANAMAQRMRKGEFDLNDMAEQLQQVQKIGGMGGMMGMMPGMRNMREQISQSGLGDDKTVNRQLAIISSMTPKERRHPKLLDGKRKRRISSGSGSKPEDVNKLVKMHRQMADVMKMMARDPSMMQRMAGMMGLGGGKMPGRGGPTEAELALMQKELQTLDPRALEQLSPDARAALDDLKSGKTPQLPTPGAGGLPGLGGGRQGLPGLGGGGLPGLGGPRLPGGFPFGPKKK